MIIVIKGNKSCVDRLPKISDDSAVAGDTFSGDQKVQHRAFFDVADCFFMGDQGKIVSIALKPKKQMNFCKEC